MNMRLIAPSHNDFPLAMTTPNDVYSLICYNNQKSFLQEHLFINIFAVQNMEELSQIWFCEVVKGKLPIYI